ncbi:MAG: hypothetical protein ACTSU6_06735 [Candidatus Njordarchaeales archaeon]
MNNIQNSKIIKYYKPIIDGIKLLKNTDINGLVIKSKAGLGKSYFVDYAIKTNQVNAVVFKGTISEARFFKFIQDNNDKVIVMRDCGSMLRRLTFLDFLKSATDTITVRKISRMNYSIHENVSETIEFKGKIVWEINDIPRRYKEDLDAVISRSLFVELNFSFQDIKNIMKLIAKTEREKLITEYLIKKADILGTAGFNLRVQNICFKIAEANVDNWKKEIDLFLNTQVSLIRKLLYRLAGFSPVKRIDFARFIIKELGVSYSTAQRMIKEGLYLKEIYSNNLMKQSLISLKPFN